jgi:hypothetical protein
MKFSRCQYVRLNPRQKENHNFQKISAVLASYGFSTIRLSDDWKGADFLALHADGHLVLRVQLKPRLFFKKEYRKKNLWMCFPEDNGAYLFPHDRVLAKLLKQGRIINRTDSWDSRGTYSIKYVPPWMKPLLARYYLTLDEEE